MNVASQFTPQDPNERLEQQFTYRLNEYVASTRKFDAEFTLAGIRGWILCQRWPMEAPTATLECLAVLSWAVICQVEAAPDREDEIRRELGRQLDFLTGYSTRRPASLDVLLSPDGRRRLYTNLRAAAEPGAGRRLPSSSDAPASQETSQTALIDG